MALTCRQLSPSAPTPASVRRHPRVAVMVRQVRLGGRSSTLGAVSSANVDSTLVLWFELVERVWREVLRVLSDCCHESARPGLAGTRPGTALRRESGPGRTTPAHQGSVPDGDVILERTAGLDVAKASVTVCERTPGRS